AEMERTMRINEDVLRFLTIRVDGLEEGPSAVMQSRGRSDDRPRRSFGDDRPPRGYGEDRPPREPREQPTASEGAEAWGIVTAAADAGWAAEAAGRGGHSSGAANPVPSRGQMRPRSTTRT